MKPIAAMMAAAALLATPISASEDIPDQYPQSELYSKPVEFIPHVFSAIGATAPPTYENAGHNNNLSFVITGDGVVVINGGASAKLAEALHEEIRQVTDQPVKLVINENGQGHAMLGNSYWAGLGVDILAHVDAIHEIEEEGDFILQRMQGYNKDRAEGTEVVAPNLSFEDKRVIEMAMSRWRSCTSARRMAPGDTQVWIPQWDTMVAGDIAFHERMLPVFSETCTSCWIETWETAFAPMQPTYVIPGHGHPTNLDQVTRYTLDYLKDIRSKIGAHLDAGGDLADAYYVDQSEWAHLDTFEELATKNAGRIYEEMEWE